MWRRIKGPQCSRPRKRKNKNLLHKAIFLFLFFCPPAGFEPVYLPWTGLLSYDHTTVKAPHPIRTAKLSTVGPDQYYGRGLRGNLRCCMAFFIFLVCLSRSPAELDGLFFWSACPDPPQSWMDFFFFFFFCTSRLLAGSRAPVAPPVLPLTRNRDLFVASSGYIHEAEGRNKNNFFSLNPVEIFFNGCFNVK